MANENNLIPNNKRSPSEVRANGRKGGINSGKTRRKQKTYKELAKVVMSAKIENDELIEIAAMYGIENPDVKTMTLLGMVRAAATGSHNAFDRLVELTGEKKTDSNADVMSKLDKVIGEVDELAK